MLVTDTRLAIRALFYLALFSTALAVIFTALYISLRPRMRHAHRVNEKLTERLAAKSKELVEAHASAQAEADLLGARIARLEEAGTALSAELRRVDAIRDLTEKRCTELNKLVEHVDLSELPAKPSRLQSQPLPLESAPAPIPVAEADDELGKDFEFGAWFDEIDAAIRADRRAPDAGR